MDRDLRLALIALLSLTAIGAGELLEQVVFVPNWLIGDVDSNMHHFRLFKHTTDPGMFYFPVSLVALVSHLMLLGKGSKLGSEARARVKRSLLMFLVVLGLTAYVIAAINVPVIDQGQLSGEPLRQKVILWAVLNVPRIVLPFMGVLQLSSLLRGSWQQACPITP